MSSRVRAVRATELEWSRWAEAAAPGTVNGWLRLMLNAAADAALAERARRADELRQRELLREAMGR